MPQAFRSPTTLALSAWLVGFALFVGLEGVPTHRAAVLAWVLLAVLAVGVARPRTTLHSLVTTWLPLFGALVAYDLLRGMSDPADLAAAATWPQLDLDLWLGGGATPTEHLQHALWNPDDPSWWDYAGWVVYHTHFLVPLLLGVALWGTGHRLAIPYLLGIAALSWVALATYALYPAQPPWMTARDGLTGDVDRIVRQLWEDVGVERAARVFSTEHATGNSVANQVAALPSLHAAFPMFIAILLRGIHRRLDLLLGAYVVAMGVTLVYAGEHFTFDVVLGWLDAMVVATLVVRVGTSRSLASRRAPVHGAAAVLGSGGTPVLRSSASRRP